MFWKSLWTSSLGYIYSHTQIFCNNQSPFPPRLLSKDVVGCETKHKHILPTISKRDRLGQLPLYFYQFRSVARFWNSLLTSNNALLKKINEADLRLAHRKGSWTFEVLSTLYKIPGANVHISAIMSRSKINISDFKLLLHEQTV